MTVVHHPATELAPVVQRLVRYFVSPTMKLGPINIPLHIREELPPPDVFDPVIEYYKRDVDRTLLRENLKLTPQQRADKFAVFLLSLDQIRGAATRAASNKASSE